MLTIRARGYAVRVPNSRNDGSLSREERHRLALLGLPTFGLALAITVVSTYVPTVARQFTSSTTTIGVVIGAEGIGAILLPVLVGAWSDRLRTRWGGRLPFVVAGAPLVVAALLGMGFVGSMPALALAVAVFFVGYFVAYEPYRAFYPDLVRDDAAGRAQSTQAVWRGVGTGLALLGGGLLLSIGQAAPFLVAAVLVGGSIALFVLLVARGEEPEQDGSSKDALQTVAEMAELLRSDQPLRAFFFANALLELALGALKTFVILWLVRGLGVRLGTASLVVGAAALPILAGAAVAGKLGDRLGRRRVMAVAAVLFGAPMVVPLLTTSRPLIVAVAPFIAAGGGVMMSLPYALLQPLMPDERHGALTGYYSASRGLGVMLGPLLGGVAISVGSGAFGSTEGYAAMWGVCGAAALASVPLILRVRREPARS
jgi:MFS family permease